jgi:hypothetical protein
MNVSTPILSAAPNSPEQSEKVNIPARKCQKYLADKNQKDQKLDHNLKTENVKLQPIFSAL